jgi:hypothetical protein
VADQISESLGIHGTELLDEHPGGVAIDVGLRPEGRGARTFGRWGDDDDGSWKEFIRLDHDAVAVAMLPLQANRLLVSRADDRVRRAPSMSRTHLKTRAV